ncbi:MAG: hypothetical protein ABJH63_15205 [Rhizobiaceae bacterium]
MNRILIAAALAIATTGIAHAKSLTGAEMQKIYPGTWNMVTKKGLKVKITFERDGSGKMRIGSKHTPFVWKVKGNKLCTSRVAAKGLKESCSSARKIGTNKYKSSNGTIISK